MMRTLKLLIAGLLLFGCAAPTTETAADLNAALSIAAAFDSAYAASPGADATKVAKMAQLLAAAQAATIAWVNSSSPADQAAASAAMAALVAYEAEAPKPQ